MNQDEKELWGKVRAAGRNRYVLHNGIIKMGVPFGLLYLIGTLILSRVFNHPKPAWFVVVNFIFIVSAVGLIQGNSTWNRYERDYKDSGGED